MQKRKSGVIDFSEGFPLVVTIKATGEQAQVVEYIPTRPPRFRVKNSGGKIKEMGESDIELADKMTPVRKKLRPISPALKKKIRERLAKRRIEVQKELWEIRKKKRPLEDAAQRISGNHPAEVNADNESPTQKQREQNCIKRLWKIGLALVMLENDIYGLCRVCHKPISLARLDKVPETSICVACKEEKQDNPSNHRRRKPRR